MKFTTQFNSSIEPVRQFSTSDKVVRSLRDECDINVIFDKYCGSDVLPVVREFRYDNVSYNDALAIVNSVKSDYETLPSKIRAEFGSVESYVDCLTAATLGDNLALSKMTNLGILKPSSVDLSPNGSQELVNEPASDVSSAVTTPTESN